MTRPRVRCRQKTATLRNTLMFEARVKATEDRLRAEAAMEVRLLEMADRVLG